MNRVPSARINQIKKGIVGIRVLSEKVPEYGEHRGRLNLVRTSERDSTRSLPVILRVYSSCTALLRLSLVFSRQRITASLAKETNFYPYVIVK